jgi:hypothetical protein
MYAEALFSLIEEFVNSHAVDKDRIYIGGCSNGGFMTIRQIVDHPDYFAAGYPMCEALYDDTISDEDIQNIKDVPIWFLHAMTDGLVDPKITSVPTYKRLMAAGAKNTHFTYIDDRPPFNRMVNHGCWPIGLNNEHNYDFDGQPVMLETNCFPAAYDALLHEDLNGSLYALLEKLGVDRVVIPEYEYAGKLARSLTSHNVLDYIELSDAYGILEIPAPKSWVGKTLMELNIRAKLGVKIIAVESENVTNISPAASYRIQEGDIMAVLGDNKALETVQKL